MSTVAAVLRLIAVSVFLAACAPIKHTTTATQPVGAPLMAGIGDVLVHVNKQRNLVNAFGGSDIFGRKTDEGFSTLHFAGVEKDGTIVLYRQDVTIVTNETTMSRSPFVQGYSTSSTRYNGQLDGRVSQGGNYSGSVSGTASTSGHFTAIVPTSDYHAVIPSGAVPIRLPPGTAVLPFEGYTVTILQAQPAALSYRVEGQGRTGQ